MLVEVGREVADAQASVMAARRTPRQRRIHRGDVQRVMTRDLELLKRIVDEHGMGEDAGLGRRAARQRADGPAELGQRLVGTGPAARLALEEDELGARRQIAAADAEDDRGADALRGLGLQTELLERHAEAKVRKRVVHLQRQRVEERADRVFVAIATLQRDRERDVMVAVARDVGGQRAQTFDCVLGTAEAEQRVRFEQIGGRGARRGRAQAACTACRVGGATGLDQGMRRVQDIGWVAVQRRCLLERLRRKRPLLALRVALAGLPTPMSARLGGRWSGSRGSRKRKGHGGAIGATRARRRLWR